MGLEVFTLKNSAINLRSDFFILREDDVSIFCHLIPKSLSFVDTHEEPQFYHPATKIAPELHSFYTSHLTLHVLMMPAH